MVAVAVQDVDILDEMSEKSWKEFQNVVEELGWYGDDLSVLTLAPMLPSTRAVLGRKESDGTFAGCVVWNEYDGLSWIGFYIVIEELRGKGLGSRMWKRAIERISHSQTIGLRAVLEMIPKYSAVDCPIFGRLCYKFVIPTIDLSNFNGPDRHEATALTPAILSKLLELDAQITGKDRSDFLNRYLALPFVTTSVFLASDGTVAGWASSCPTGKKEEGIFKIAPVYATNLGVALTLMQSLTKSIPETSKVVFYTQDDSAGSKHLHPFLENQGFSKVPANQTLYSKPFQTNFDYSRCFVPHNNSSHFDA